MDFLFCEVGVWRVFTEHAGWAAQWQGCSFSRSGKNLVKNVWMQVEQLPWWCPQGRT